MKSHQGEDGEYPALLLSAAPDEGEEDKQALNFADGFSNLHPDERIVRFIVRHAKNNPNGFETLFAGGLEHGNATLSNSLMNTIFLRHHNQVARDIAKANPAWDDERVFQTTRNVMIVILLQIVISDYIRHISPLNLPIEVQPGFAETQGWYRTNRIAIEFNLLYRWHGLVADSFSFLPEPGSVENITAFRHNNQWLLDTGVAKAVTLFSKEAAGQIKIGNTPKFLTAAKKDTLTMMRAGKLQSYNNYCRRFNRPPAKSFRDITSDRKLAAKLSELYDGKIEDLEWYVGLFAEDHGPDMIMGEFLTAMVAHDAFTQALTNPLLSNEVFKMETFGKTGWWYIKNTKRLEDMVRRVVPDDTGLVCSFKKV